MHADRLARGLLAVVLLCAGSPVGAQSASDGAVGAATAAVREAFGGDAEVTLTSPVLSLVPRADAVAAAVPEASSRTGGRVRFVLYGAEVDGMRRRVGRLTADVRVVAPHVRATQPLAAGTVLASDLVEEVRADIGRQPLAALPTLSQLGDGTTRTALRAGDIVTPVVLVMRALVSSGHEVVTVARVAGLEVRGRAIAAQSGGLGQTVIVVNPDSRKRLRGRVVAEDVVEVLHGS